MKHHIIVMILGLSVLKTTAADFHWYLGAGGGLAEVHGGYDRVVDVPFVPTPAPVTSGNTVTILGSDSIDPVHGLITESGASVHQTRSTGNPVATWNLAAGYRFSPYLAVEADYEQPSAINSLTVFSYPADSDQTLVHDQTRHSDLGISVVGSYPLGACCRLFGGAGLGWSWERDQTIVDGTSANPVRLFDATSSQQFLRAQLRAGVEVSLTHALSFRVGWDRPDTNLRNWRGYNSVQELSIDNFSATVLWAF